MRRKHKITLWGLVVAGAGVIVILTWLKPWAAVPVAHPPIPLPPVSESPFLNVGPDARLIGVDACASCHPHQHRSYLLTAHSRALGDVDIDDEPPDGAFFHKASGRSYRVFRQGKTL